MFLGLRWFIVASVAIHAAVIGAVAWSPFGAPRSSAKTGTATLTLRSTSKAPKANSKANSKPSPKASSPKPNQAKAVPKIIPVMRPDASLETIPEPEAPPSETETSLGPVVAAEGPVGVSLEREAQLVAGSLTKPEYTPEALKVRLQGLFAVDVHLSDNGEVLEIELVQSPGFGMDERIVAALKGAKYLAKRDAGGTPLETWITIQFRLEIP